MSDKNIKYLIKSSNLYAENTKNQLKDALSWVVKEASSALWELHEGSGLVNSFGIIQSAGQDVDRLAALYMERKQKAEEIQKLLGKED